MGASMHFARGRGRNLRLNYGLVVVPFVSVLTIAIKAGGASGPHGTIDLIADETSVQPGRNFWVGLHFQIEKGWHIYWINPGDSGEPPQVEWNLPPGFRAGPLEWPTPRRIEDHSLIDYGYQDEVLLPVEIHPPTSLGRGRDIGLGAAIHWLVCREACVPGRAALSLTLPVQKQPPGQPSRWHSLFARTRTSLPKATPKQWRLTANLEGRRFHLDINTGRREAKAAFFPLEPNQIENAAPQHVSPYSRGVRLDLEKSDQLRGPIRNLAGVLVVGSGRAYVTNFPVVASNLH
jgi:DsbC/DsbD-like thiol-disulfide interchange protein